MIEASPGWNDHVPASYPSKWGVGRRADRGKVIVASRDAGTSDAGFAGVVRVAGLRLPTAFRG